MESLIQNLFSISIATIHEFLESKYNPHVIEVYLHVGPILNYLSLYIDALCSVYSYRFG